MNLLKMQRKDISELAQSFSGHILYHSHFNQNDNLSHNFNESHSLERESKLRQYSEDTSIIQK